MKLIINCKPVEFDGDWITYIEIVRLAGKTGNPTVVYRGRRDGDSERSGTMYAGGPSVKLDPDMVFTVMHTGNA